MNSAQRDAELRETAALLAGGNVPLAEQRARAILVQSPDCVEALYILAQCVRKRGGQEYESLLRRVLAQALHPQASLELAQLLLERGQMEECEEHARSAVAFAPRNPLAHRTMGIVFLAAGRAAAAEFHFRKLIALVGEQPRACTLLAEVLKLLGRLDESEQWFAKAAALDPTNVEVWISRCRMAEARRKLPEAWDMLRRAEAIAPGLDGTIRARAVLLAREGRWSEADTFLTEAIARQPQNAELYLGRGRARKQLGLYDEAWRDFSEGKRICREIDGLMYGREHVDELIDRLKQLFTADRMAAIPRAGEKQGAPQPIFILGFPRSGTTLIEQILEQHGQVRAGDELDFLAQVASLAPRWIGSHYGYPECLAELAVGDNVFMADRLRDSYLDRVEHAGLLSGGHRFFTDKMPLNEVYLGLIAILFPRSPLILMRRHPLDIVCSNFEWQLSHGFNQAFDVATIARHITAMDDLAEYYRRELNLDLLDIRYEDVIADPEREVRRLLDFVGLEFDPRCLHFEESARIPRTISYAQVGDKLHDRSVFRYRAFRKHLAKAVEILEPVIRRLGYPID